MTWNPISISSLEPIQVSTVCGVRSQVSAVIDLNWVIMAELGLPCVLLMTMSVGI